MNSGGRLWITLQRVATLDPGRSKRMQRREARMAIVAWNITGAGTGLTEHPQQLVVLV